MHSTKEDLTLRKEIEELMDNGYGKVVIARELGISEGKASRMIKKIKEGVPPEKEVPILQLPYISKQKTKVKHARPKTGSILVVGDSHAKPGESNERYSKLGRLIVDLQPDAVVQMGDFFDMPSLSSYDVGKKSFEGRRYNLDLEAGWDALERIKKELSKGKFKKPPLLFSLLGNHEIRIEKAVNNDAKLEGTMSLDNLRFDEFGWEVIPFLRPLELMGITFQHYFTSGSMDRAISSENAGRAILKKYHASCLAGHTHKLDLAWEANAKGKLMMSGTVGCYFEHFEEWQSLQAQKHFWRGVLYLQEVEDGSTRDMQFITLDSINKNY